MSAYGLQTWSKVIAHTFGNMVVDAPAQGFSADIRHRTWGTLALSTVDSTPACVDGGRHCG